MEALASRFAKTTVVILENGSRDGTRAALEAWSPARAEVVLPSVPELPKFDTAPRVGDLHAMFDARRIGKMSFLRNLCLDEMRRRAADADYGLLIDLDVRDFSVEGVMSCFEADEDWDAVAANGVQIDRLLGPRIYRDTYAFRDRGEAAPRSYHDLGPLQRSVARRLAESQGLLPVASAFGGLAVYRASAIFAGRYELRPNADSIVAYECEHVSLHREMSEAGYGRVFINPKMKLFYNSRLECWRLESEMAARRLVRAFRRIGRFLAVRRRDAL